MIHIFKKQIALLFIGLISFLLVECNVISLDFEKDITIRTVNEYNEVIVGLKVILTNNGERISEDYSNELGYVYYLQIEDNDSSDYKVIIKDIDGDANGGMFKSEVLDIHNFKSDYIVYMSEL